MRGDGGCVDLCVYARKMGHESDARTHCLSLPRKASKSTRSRDKLLELNIVSCLPTKKHVPSYSYSLLHRISIACFFHVPIRSVPVTSLQAMFGDACRLAAREVSAVGRSSLRNQLLAGASGAFQAPGWFGF